MAKLGGMNGLGSGFGGLKPATPSVKGGLGQQGGLSGNGSLRMNDKQGQGGVVDKGVGQTQTSVGAQGQKMDNRDGKGIVNKSVGEVKTSVGGGGEKMGKQGSK